jgi:hypothetical protein
VWEVGWAAALLILVQRGAVGISLENLLNFSTRRGSREMDVATLRRRAR